MVDLSTYLRVSWIRGSGWRWLVRAAASCRHGFSSHGCGCRGAELSLLRVSSEFWYIIASNSHPGPGKLNRGLVYFTLLIFSPEGKQPGLGFSLVVAWANDAKEQGLVFAVMVSGYAAWLVMLMKSLNINTAFLTHSSGTWKNPLASAREKARAYRDTQWV